MKLSPNNQEVSSHPTAFTAPFTRDPALPLHSSIADWITHEAQRAAASPGTKLPAERELAAHLGVSRMTLRNALDNLVGRGFLRRTPGPQGGSFIAEARPVVDISNLMGLGLQLVRSFNEVHSEVISADTLLGSEDPVAACALGLTDDDALLRIRRARYADGNCVVLEDSRFPAGLFPDLLDQPLDGSLYQVMRETYGRAPSRAEEELHPQLPSSETARLMGIPTAAPILNIVRTSYTHDALPVEYSSDIFRTDLLTLVTRGSLDMPC